MFQIVKAVIYVFQQKLELKKKKKKERKALGDEVCLVWFHTLYNQAGSHKSVNYIKGITCSCGSVVKHCISSAKGCGFNSQGTHMHCKLFRIKASAKCINVT